VPFDKALLNLVPDARKSGGCVVLPHKQDAVRLARNAGFLVPAPITSLYDWNGDTPFRTQKITAALLTMQRRAYVLSEMGTGKTRAALHAVNWMMMQGDIRAVLVVAPLSTLSQVWDREIFQYFNHLSVGVLYGTREKREKVLAEKHHVYVINHDGIKVIKQALIEKEEIDCVIVDELAVFRNKTADRWGHLFDVLHNRPYVWGLTGAPTPNEPVDAWAQVKLLTPNRVTTYIKAFKRKTMRQVSTFKWIALSDANETVYAAMQPAVRYKRDDCIELPPISYQTRECSMTKTQGDVYKRLLRILTIMFDRGEVTAANEGVLFSKLLQIASGWVYTKEKNVVSLDNRPRIEQLTEVLNEADGKVIVFAEFTHTATALQSILANKKYDTVLVTGATSKGVRDTIFGDFQTAVSPRIIVAHPKCMAHGLTLTEANVICWFTPTTSLETYEQANARISRPGQIRKQLIIHLTGSPIETKLYRRLQERKSLQGALLEMFEE
jgi:SNF2 family DNA or RNA helicase